MHGYLHLSISVNDVYECLSVVCAIRVKLIFRNIAAVANSTVLPLHSLYIVANET